MQNEKDSMMMIAFPVGLYMANLNIQTTIHREHFPSLLLPLILPSLVQSSSVSIEEIFDATTQRESHLHHLNIY